MLPKSRKLISNAFDGLSFIDKNNPAKIKDMEFRIYMNEKWFYMTRKCGRYLLV